MCRLERVQSRPAQRSAAVAPSARPCPRTRDFVSLGVRCLDSAPPTPPRACPRARRARRGGSVGAAHGFGPMHCGPARTNRARESLKDGAHAAALEHRLPRGRRSGPLVRGGRAPPARFAPPPPPPASARRTAGAGGVGQRPARAAVPSSRRLGAGKALPCRSTNCSFAAGGVVGERAHAAAGVPAPFAGPPADGSPSVLSRARPSRQASGFLCRRRTLTRRRGTIPCKRGCQMSGSENSRAG
jgi:hypothetical protein